MVQMPWRRQFPGCAPGSDSGVGFMHRLTVAGTRKSDLGGKSRMTSSKYAIPLMQKGNRSHLSSAMRLAGPVNRG
jgi:hypothetical protein